MKIAMMLFLICCKPAFALVMALDMEGKMIEAGRIYTAGSEAKKLVDRNNTHFEFSPHSVYEFQKDGALRLLRGSVIADSKLERSLFTTSAKVDFVGRVLVSYDHKEKSTSSFVVEGQARVVNPFEKDRTILLDQMHGASMAVGDVFPQIIRQLDFTSVDSWMKGYGWGDSARASVIKMLPKKAVVAKEDPAPEHLREAKLEDYFSAIEVADDKDSPNYYERKLGDPDIAIMEANSNKSIKVVSPEEAAMIPLPSNKIELEMELPLQTLTMEAKAEELKSLSPVPHRSIASVGKPEKAKPVKKERALDAKKASSETGDVEVDQVLERLRGMNNKPSEAVEHRTRSAGRGLASEGSDKIVPDPVYDFSQNF